MKVEWKEADRDIQQIHSEGLEYAFVSEDGRQVYPLLFCKEFLMDVVWATVNECKAKLYGFRYDPETDPPLSPDVCRVLLRNRLDENFVKSAKQAVKFLNQIEADMGWDLTVCEECETGDMPSESAKKYPVVMFASPKGWMKAPPMLSLYSLFVRVGMTYTKGNWSNYLEKVKTKKVKTIQANDSYYLGAAWDTIHEIINTSAARFSGDMEENWPAIKEIILHENGGIVSLATQPRAVKNEICSHWFTEKEKAKDDNANE